MVRGRGEAEGSGMIQGVTRSHLVSMQSVATIQSRLWARRQDGWEGGILMCIKGMEPFWPLKRIEQHQCNFTGALWKLGYRYPFVFPENIVFVHSSCFFFFSKILVGRMWPKCYLGAYPRSKARYMRAFFNVKPDFLVTLPKFESSRWRMWSNVTARCAHYQNFCWLHPLVSCILLIFPFLCAQLHLK